MFSSSVCLDPIQAAPPPLFDKALPGLKGGQDRKGGHCKHTAPLLVLRSLGHKSPDCLLTKGAGLCERSTPLRPWTLMARRPLLRFSFFSVGPTPD